jgi:putative ABC transport system substrate-binding protein
MRRRDLIKGIAGSTIAWPLAVNAQQTDKLPTIGVLGVNETSWGPWAAAFVARLHELGWIEGRNVAFEYRWDEGRAARDAEIGTEFVGLKVDVILANGKGAALLKQVTATIPIVFPLAPDPVRGGLVASLARPGGNITGLSIQATDLASKRLDLLREVVPGLRRLAIIFDAGYSQAALEVDEVEAMARTVGVDVTPLEIRRAADIAPAFEVLRADALYVVLNSLINANRTRITSLAIGARLPTMFGAREYAQVGALMSYGPNFPDLFRHAADIVNKILHGAKPADIPVEQPTKFELVFNLKTAKAIGLMIPPNLLAIADEVIE